jgi:hypothetical protein
MSTSDTIPAPGGRVVDPQHPEDRKTLDALTAAAEAALATDRAADREVRFDRGFLASRMAFIFGRPQPEYWSLHQAIHRACAAAAIDAEYRCHPRRGCAEIARVW